MRLLVVDADRRLGELIRSVASRDGHSVWFAESAVQALALGARHQPQVILGALELGGEDGLAPLKTLRDTLSETPDIILTSVSRGRYDPQVQAAMDTLQARDFLRQPLSVLDLMDMLRRLAARQPASAASAVVLEPAPQRRVRVRNLIQLARIWSNRLSGTLSCIDPHRIRRTVPFGDGAPLEVADLELVGNGLREGSFEFERGTTHSKGHREALSRLLWEAAREHERANFAQANLYKAPVLTGALDAVLALPISMATRGILAQADGAILLAELLAGARASRQQVSDDLVALDRMRLIVFQSPVSRGRVQSNGNNASKTPARKPTPRRDRPAGSVVRPARTPARTVTRSPERSKTAHSTVANSVSRFSVSRSGRRSVLSPKQISRIISQDITRLPSAAPASVLMCAADAPEDERKKAARRLIRRYRGFADRRDISEEERRQARRLQQYVVDAYKRLAAGDNSPGQPQARKSMPDTKAALLREGVRLIQKRAWPEADACLSRAQALDAVDPLIMAHLGWARLHNPRIDRAVREQDGAAQINLAYQFLPGNADVLYYMASNQLREGHHRIVDKLLTTAIRMFPDDSRFTELAEELQELDTPTVT